MEQIDGSDKFGMSCAEYWDIPIKECTSVTFWGFPCSLVLQLCWGLDWRRFCGKRISVMRNSKFEYIFLDDSIKNGPVLAWFFNLIVPHSGRIDFEMCPYLPWVYESPFVFYRHRPIYHRLRTYNTNNRITLLGNVRDMFLWNVSRRAMSVYHSVSLHIRGKWKNFTSFCL